MVDVGSEDEEFGYWGEVLTTSAESRGIAGLVIDGGVRDASALAAHGFPVFSTIVALQGASKNRPGTVGATVAVGGVSVGSGDWLVGDADGVAVVSGGESRATCFGPAGHASRRKRRCSVRSGRERRPSSSWVSTPRRSRGRELRR